jgi:hypothetical protein
MLSIEPKAAATAHTSPTNTDPAEALRSYLDPTMQFLRMIELPRAAKLTSFSMPSKLNSDITERRDGCLAAPVVRLGD